MPCYVYEDDDGNRIEEVRPVTERDQAPPGFKRIAVPDSLNIAGCAKNPREKTALDGYYKQECKMGSKFKSRHSPEAIKRAWAT